MAGLLDRHLSPVCPGWREEHDLEAVWGLVDGVPDRALWEVHLALKARLVARLREGRRRAFAAGDAEPAALAAGGALLDPEVLTIGFARRFSTYKRADLVFADPDRLRRILTDPARPVQLVFAGKAHPADEEGQAAPPAGARVRPRPRVRGEDRVHGGLRRGLRAGPGPRRRRLAQHARAAARGLGHERHEGRDERGRELLGPGRLVARGLRRRERLGLRRRRGGDRTAADAAALYDLLETEIAPRYYERGPDGVPHAWVDDDEGLDPDLRAAVLGAADGQGVRRPVLPGPPRRDGRGPGPRGRHLGETSSDEALPAVPEGA